MKVRPGAVIRGTGVAFAHLAHNTSTRSGIMLAAYAGGWFVNKPGLQVFLVFPDADEPWKRGSVPFASAVSVWTTAMLAASRALRRTRLPGPVGAVVLGTSFIAIDSVLADLGERREEAKAAARRTEEERRDPGGELPTGASAPAPRPPA